MTTRFLFTKKKPKMNKKVVLILPAYNASYTLKPFLNRLPKNIFAEIILVDDCSTDGTYELAKKQKDISVFQTLQNLGYGGNLKFCLGKALEKGADIIIELHPDGEYAPDGIKPAIQKIEKGAKLILGERKNLLSSGFPLWKYPFVKLLNFIDNLILGSSIVDLHQGFRVYSRELLEKVNFRAGSNNYIFSFEIIVQTIFQKLKIETVPVTVKYQGKKRGANLRPSIYYTLGTFLVSFFFLLAKLGLKSTLFAKPHKPVACPLCSFPFLVEQRYKIDRFNVYYCKMCQIGFILPQPEDISSYYPSTYWNFPGIVGFLRKMAYIFFQKRRVKWIKKYHTCGNILDVGAGEGIFARELGNKFKVVSQEIPSAKIFNKEVLKLDFLRWQTKEKFSAVVFWESLEHTPSPQKYLHKAFQLLKKGGYLFVEYPRYLSFERKIFGKNWFHLDIPRHLFHFTDRGLDTIARRTGFSLIKKENVLAIEYAPLGLYISILNFLGIKAQPISLFLTFPIFIFAFFLEIIVFFLGQSPIGLVVAKKN